MTGLVLLAFGCTDTPLGEDVHQVHRQAIMGGTVDDANTSVVGILIQVNGDQAICSGTLIAPNLVLTAQHCVAQISSPYVQCGQTPFGAEYPPGSFHVTTETNLPEEPNSYYDVAAVHTPPGTNDTCGFDIALLELQQNIDTTEPVTPRIDVPITEGEVYTAVGYGHIGNGSGAGTRRQLDGRHVLCGTGECSLANGIEEAEFAGTDGTCQGDSGGAALDADGRVLGALSRGPDGCAGSVYSAVDAWAGWLREMGDVAATNGAYDPPTWVEFGISEVPPDDPDLDQVVDPGDNCPEVPNEDQLDMDADGVGDACDDDIDGDGILNDVDNCPLHVNPKQYDNDNDSFGDACDQDDDGDGVMDENDNCQFIPNADQQDVCSGDPTLNPTPQGPGADPATQPGVSTDDDDFEVVLVDEPDSIHATGKACAGSGNVGEMAGILLFLPGLWLTRRRRRFRF